MNTKSADSKVSVDWAEEVLFLLPIAVRPHSETRLLAAPIMVEFVERAAESKDRVPHTGNTEFFHREVPPAKAA